MIKTEPTVMTMEVDVLLCSKVVRRRYLFVESCQNRSKSVPEMRAIVCETLSLLPIIMTGINVVVEPCS